MNGQKPTINLNNPPVLRVTFHEGDKEPIVSQIALNGSLAKQSTERRVSIAVLTEDGVAGSITVPTEALSFLMARVMGAAERREQSGIVVPGKPGIIMPN